MFVLINTFYIFVYKNNPELFERQIFWTMTTKYEVQGLSFIISPGIQCGALLNCCEVSQIVPIRRMVRPL